VPEAMEAPEAAFHELPDCRIEPVEDLLCACLGEPARLDGFVETLPGGRHEDVHETLDRLPLGLRDVGQGVAVRQPFAKLCDGQAEVVGRVRERGSRPVWPEAELELEVEIETSSAAGRRSEEVRAEARAEDRPSEERRHVARPDPLLEAIGLLLCDVSRLEAASTWSMAAARVASSSFSREMPRCFATESRNDDGERPRSEDAAIAAPPAPSTTSAAVATARFLFELSALIAGFQSEARRPGKALGKA
jgi:hypothetical protein